LIDSTYERWIVPSNPDPASTRFEGGDGSSWEEAYVMTKPAHLIKLSEDVANGVSYGGSFFRLGNDIDLGGVLWRPIGYCSGPFDKMEFSGSVDGAGRSVSNFTVEGQGDRSAGFFGYIEYSLIQNLVVKDFEIKDGDSAAGLVGYSETSTIAGCFAEGIVTGASNIGGIVGLACNSMRMNSVSDVSINVSDGNVAGGLCGYVYNGSRILNCESKGDIDASNTGEVGGFVGSIKDGILENCHAGASVTAVDCGNVGGFGGLMRNCRLDWCFARGAVNAENEKTNALVGGFAGFTNSELTRCAAFGSVSKSGAIGSVGGFVGEVAKGSIYSSYSSGPVAGDGFVGGFAGSANCADGAVTTIENCCCLGPVTSEKVKSLAGGFIGNMKRQGGNVVVTKCYAYGELSPKVKGFTAGESLGSVVDCVWRRDESGVNDDRSDGRGIQSLTTTQFSDADIFAGMGWSIYDPESAWRRADEITPPRPHLNGMPVV
jgi:hypothetical protein